MDLKNQYGTNNNQLQGDQSGGNGALHDHLHARISQSVVEAISPELSQQASRLENLIKELQDMGNKINEVREEVRDGERKISDMGDKVQDIGEKVIYTATYQAKDSQGTSSSAGKAEDEQYEKLVKEKLESMKSEIQRDFQQEMRSLRMEEGDRMVQGCIF